MPDLTGHPKGSGKWFLTWRQWIFKIMFPIILMIIWYLLTRFSSIPSLVLPRLDTIFHDFIGLMGSGELQHHIFLSLKRSLTGFFLGSAAGILSGVAMGWHRFWGDFFDLTINFIRSIPKTALAPLFIIWFGLGDLSKILLICLSSFFFTVIPTIEGVKNVDQLLIKSARSMGANEWQLMKNVILPASLPAIFAGIRLAVTTSLIVLVMVEIISGNNGLGYLLQDARENLDMSIMFATLFTLGVLGYSLDAGVRILARFIMPWRKGKTISR